MKKLNIFCIIIGIIWFLVAGYIVTDKILIKEDNKIEINCDENKFNTKINCLNSDDFPVIPEIERKNKYVVEVKDFKNILPRIINCVSLNNTRPEINGILLKIEDNQNHQ